MFKKNTAVTGFTFGLVDSSDGSAVTTGTTTGYVTIDGGTQGAIAGAATHEGNGQWSVDLTAAEMNGDIIGLVFVNSSAINASFTIPTYTTIDSNVLSLAGDSTAASNCALGWNGVGVTGENLPATQGQVGGISSGGGGIKTIASSVTLTTGTTSSALSDSFYLDNAFYAVTPAAGAVDFYFEFDVGDNATSTEVIIALYVQGNNDEVTVSQWDYIGLQWNPVKTVIGTSAQTLQNITADIVNNGTKDGKTRIRFSATSISAIGIEQVLCEYSSITDSGFVIREGFAQGGTLQTITLDAGASSQDDAYLYNAVIFPEGTGAGQGGIIVGYNGANKVATLKEPVLTVPDTTTKFRVLFAQTHSATQSRGYDDDSVYVDTTNGIDGAVVGVNGTVENPVLTMAAARALADNPRLNLNRVTFDKGVDIISLDQDYVRFTFSGKNPVAVDAGGYDISFSSFLEMVVTGTSTNNTGLSVYQVCGIIDYNCGNANFINCGLVQRLTMSQDGAYYTSTGLWTNKDAVTGPTPEIVFASGAQGIGFESNSQKGNFVIKGMKANDIYEVTGSGVLTLDSSVNGGTIKYAGDIRIIDNSTASPIFECGNICETSEAVKLMPTNAQLEARTLLSAEYGTATTQATINDNVLTRLPTASYVAPDNATIADTNTKVTALPSAAQIDAQLSGVHGAGSWLTGGGGTATDVNIISVNGSPTSSINDFKADVSGLATSSTTAQILADTNELQQNQGNWLTATGFSTFNPATDIVARVTLVDTTTANTDMRGTDNALLASDYTAPDNATIASIDGKIDTLTLSVGDIPKTAAFEARTLIASEYSAFDPVSDSVTINQASADLVLASGNIDGFTLEQSQRLILSASAGKLSGAATSNVVIRDAGDTKARITATVDQDGNRISTTLDAS